MTNEEVKAITDYIEVKICKNCPKEKCIDCNIIGLFKKVEDMKKGGVE